MTVVKFFTDVYNGALVVFLLTLIASLGMTFTLAQIAAPSGSGCCSVSSW
jgi:hypothetical protein